MPGKRIVRTVRFYFFDMRKYLLSLFVVLAVGCYAQGFQRPDYETIQKVAHTETYDQLLTRYQALDTTLTLSELQTLYYGSIFVGKSSFNGLDKEVKDLLEDKRKTNEAAEAMDRHLDKYPFDLQALVYRTVPAGRNNDTALVRNLWEKAELVVATIVSTGDGQTDSTGFHVVSVSDEYALMDYIFKVEHGNQYLTASKCDKFDISVNGNKANLYFDIQALLAWEKRVFGRGNINKPFTFTYDTSAWDKANDAHKAAMTINKKLELPELTEETTVEEYDAYKPKVIECMEWLLTHDPGTKNAMEKMTNLEAQQFLVKWCAGVSGCMFALEKEFFSYKTKELGGYFLGGWAAYYARTEDNDAINGRIAGIDAIIKCYTKYPKSLKKDKKKILAFKKMQEDGTLRQYVVEHIGK